MAFDLFQLYTLRNSPDANTPVGSIPYEVSDYLGCRQSLVYFSSRSIRHAFKEHPDLDIFEILHMPDMIARGRWVSDRKKPHYAVVIYFVPDSPRKYMSALKVTGGGYEPYMASFYRTRDSDIRRVMRRGDVLREHL